jgi:hypothetical protein
MVRKIAVFAVTLVTLVAVLTPGLAQDETDGEDYGAVQVAMLQSLIQSGSSPGSIDLTVFEQVRDSGDPLYIAPLLDLAFFTRVATFDDLNTIIFDALSDMSGEDFGTNWQLWFEWAGQEDIALPPGYDNFKGLLFGTLIDPNFELFFDDVQADANVNLVEVVWGGVAVDGIPSLVNAPQVTPEEAQAQGQELTQFCRGDDCRYPAPDEYVFGVSIDGDERAYPLRILNWHEMFNDVIGAVPMYDAPSGEVVCDFRAPNGFTALARQGEDWLYAIGQSPGCPSDAAAWLPDPASLTYTTGTWDDVRDQIPEFDDGPTNVLDSTVNGSVPGTPVMLAYCTLCGSGVLYDATVDLALDGGDTEPTVLEFSSTGLLMRSNKLMYDRNTLTVWNALTGTPAFGPLVDSDIQLERLPVVVTDWASWVEQHPDTSVLSLNTGFQRNYTNGAAYADYFNDPAFLMFPVWQQDTTENENKEIVFTLLLDDTPKAYPLEDLIPSVVVNDTLAGTDLVVVAYESAVREFTEPGGATVRAYERGPYTFRPGEARRELVDQDGALWRVTESALIGPNDERLDRLPGHLAFWFGWFGFYPETLVYTPT